MGIKYIKKGYVTTIIGTLFLIADFVLFVFPMVNETFKLDVAVLIVGAFIGVGLLLSPNDVLQKFKEKL